MREHAALAPSTIAFTFLLDGERQERQLSYAELDRLARAVAAKLQAAGATGERAVLLYPPGPEYLIAFFGCLYAGVVAVPAYPPDPSRIDRTLPRLQAIVADADARFLLTTGQLRALSAMFLAGADDLRQRTWLTTDDVAPALADDWRAPDVTPETLAFLQYTSGSTGTPKGVMLRHQNLVANLALIRDAFAIRPGNTGVIWLPPYHDMGLIGGVLTPVIVRGLHVVLISPLMFLQRPMRWLQAVSRYRGEISGGPNFAYDLCVRKSTPAERAELDLSSWRLAFTGAEPIRPATLDRFVEAFGPSGFARTAFHPCYGLAEATLIVTGGQPVAGPIVSTIEDSQGAPRPLVGCGRELADHAVRVVDPETRQVRAPGELGELWAAGPSVASGYWQRPDESAETFGAYTADSQGPFLRTGDLGLFVDGELYVSGRRKDLVIVRGRNLFPQDIEQTAERAHAAVRAGCGAVFGVEAGGEERLAVAYEVDARKAGDLGEVIDAIARAVAEEHGVQPHTVALLAPGAVPKTSSGKIQRRACRAELLAGRLSVVARRDDELVERDAAPVVDEPVGSDVLSRLRALVAAEARLALSAVDADRPPASFGLDSLRTIELTTAIERDFGVTLPAALVLGARSLHEIADAIAAGPAAAATEASAAPAISAGQRALWFLWQLAPDSDAYTISRHARVRSPIDTAALRRALDALVARHPALRTTFVADHGEPRAVIAPAATAEADLTFVDVGDRNDARLQAAVASETHRPFDLAGGPLFRAVLFSRADDDHVLWIGVHHIVCDFWSLAAVLEDLGALYQAAATGAPVVHPEVAAPAARELEALGPARRAEAWKAWEARLARPIPPLELATDHPRAAGPARRGASHAFALSPALGAQVKAFAQARGTTPFATLLAGYAAVLHRYTGQAELAIGTPVAQRASSHDAAVGYLVNPLPIVVDLGHEPSFAGLVDQIAARVRDAVAHREVPLTALVERFAPRRDGHQSPLFQTLFTLLPARTGASALAPFAVGQPGATLTLGGLVLESQPVIDVAAKFDLGVMLADGDAGLLGAFEYDATLFDPPTIARLAEHFTTLLADGVARPDCAVAELALLGDRERAALTQPATAVRAPAIAPSVTALVAAQVARTPDAVAVTAGGRSLRFAELDAKSSQLAHWLRARGVGADVLVAVALPRTVDLVVALVAILKAGGAYLPIDPALPAERARLLLDDAAPRLVLVDDAAPDHLATGATRLDAIAGELAALPTTAPAPAPTPEQLAYVLYTSGSTGTPKGVAIEHRAFVNLLAAMRDQPGLGERDVLVAVTTLSFDIAGLEVFLPLVTGARLVLASREQAADPHALARLLADERATFLQATPVTFRQLVAVDWRGGDGFTVICGGEAMPADLAAQLCARAGRVFNAYGPTETTIWSTITAPLVAGAPITIGRPVRNTDAFILDSRRAPLPVGVAGELYLGGDGLARGYLHRPELTAERFVDHPFRPGERLYRTGDLARLLADGTIEYRGRVDQQIKLRGMRIELGEIEAAIRRQAGVRDAAVALATPDGGGEPRLVGYVVAASDAVRGELIAHVQTALRQILPLPMVPSLFMMLEALPVTPSGKLDRRALPRPELPRGSDRRVPPANPLEAQIVTIWEEVLGVPVGVEDNFFDLGGHSLQIVRVRGELAARVGHELPLVALFELPTVRALATRLRDGGGASLDASKQRADARREARTRGRARRQPTE
ncbi:MAG TPA: amino acid adenylation domain-containing protein [Kofleriaceae bacterium]|nr:amino acid adenylation domain-containing protein [Kofleriaceae bacterium]